MFEMILLHRKTHRVAEFAKSLYKTNFNVNVNSQKLNEQIREATRIAHIDRKSDTVTNVQGMENV